MVSNLNELKKRIFFDMLDLVGRVFILARYSKDVVIGERGFLPEEKEKGIVLVFNKRMNFDWDEDGISAKLVFGAATHQCFIPIESIVSVFSPELSAQFSASPETPHPKKEEAPAKKRSSKSSGRPAKSSDNKVVRVDFNKKK
jgi:stringent starvation protein B